MGVARFLGIGDQLLNLGDLFNQAAPAYQEILPVGHGLHGHCIGQCCNPLELSMSIMSMADTVSGQDENFLTARLQLMHCRKIMTEWF